MDGQKETNWLLVSELTNEAGFKISAPLLYGLYERSPADYDRISRMILEGEIDDLLIQPIFISLVLQTAGLDFSEEEIENLSIRERLKLVDTLEASKKQVAHIWFWAKVAHYLMVFFLLSYPVLASILLWSFLGPPLLGVKEIMDTDIHSLLSEWQVYALNWLPISDASDRFFSYHFVGLLPYLVVLVVLEFISSWMINLLMIFDLLRAPNQVERELTFLR